MFTSQNNMKASRFHYLGLSTALLLLAGCAAVRDPLPSWNDGPTKQSIITFVEQVTDENGDAYVPPPRRIATFDNDGTLWSEQPMYFQLIFTIDRIKEMAAANPQWKTTQPFKAVLEDDMETLAASGMEGLMTLLIASHGGMTTAEFEQELVYRWAIVIASE